MMLRKSEDRTTADRCVPASSAGKLGARALAILIAIALLSVTGAAMAAKKKKASPRRARSSAVSMPRAAGDVAFRSCAQVRAAGAAPIRRGDPGYSRRLDRDGDGIACE